MKHRNILSGCEVTLGAEAAVVAWFSECDGYVCVGFHEVETGKKKLYRAQRCTQSSMTVKPNLSFLFEYGVLYLSVLVSDWSFYCFDAPPSLQPQLDELLSVVLFLTPTFFFFTSSAWTSHHNGFHRLSSQFITIDLCIQWDSVKTYSTVEAEAFSLRVSKMLDFITRSDAEIHSDTFESIISITLWVTGRWGAYVPPSRAAQEGGRETLIHLICPDSPSSRFGETAHFYSLCRPGVFISLFSSFSIYCFSSQLSLSLSPSSAHLSGNHTSLSVGMATSYF